MAEKKEQTKVKAHVSEAKKKRVAELTDDVKNSKTILVASIRNIPGNQFQEIVKKLRGKAKVTVPKKNLIFRAIDSSAKENKEIEKLKEKITESVAVLFSEMDTFELASELIQGKRPAKAKEGQVAKDDIEVEKGPTDLMPGPAITELGDLGIPVKIEKGKIHIQKSKVIVKAGEEISKEAAAVMNKLNIKPFMIGFVPLCAFDQENNILYTEIKIDPEQALEDLKYAYSRALPFAVEIGYATKDTITFMLGKANAHEKALESLLDKEPEEEKKSEEEKKDESKEEAKEEKVEESEENKEDKENKEGEKESEEKVESEKSDEKIEEEKKDE